ncbi:MAG: tetratricopeptide repeat protein [Gemmatimonadota bacterium]
MAHGAAKSRPPQGRSTGTPRPTTDAAFRAALALAQSGDAPGALAQLEALHSSDARHTGVRNALGVLRLESGDSAGAIAILRPLAREHPDAAAIGLNLGNALVAAGRGADAIAPLKRAVSRDPQSAIVCYGLARALQIAGRADEAISAYERVLQLQPGHVDARASLAAALNFVDRYADAEREARAVIAALPNASPLSAGAHFNLAVSLLARAQWAEGWAEYEWRERTALLDGGRRSWTQPRWEGESLAGRTVLVHAEQGFGDTLQFVRYLPLLRERGAHVVLQCPAPLVELLRHSTLADRVISFADVLPAHDLQVPLTGLPHRLRLHSDRDVMLHDAPYLQAVAGRDTIDAGWAAAPSPRVGLVWAGSPTHVNDMHRSCGLGALSPLLRTAGVTWVSLQTGDRARDLASVCEARLVHDHAPALHDFAATAAAIRALDLVITVDSAVAHLAGALGTPCWLLLPRVGQDWRWAAEEHARSHAEPGAAALAQARWYASVRTFRQRSAGSWTDVVTDMASALASVLASASAATPASVSGISPISPVR